MDPQRLAELRQFLDFSVMARKRFSLKMDLFYICMEDFVLQEGVGFREVSPWQPSERGTNRYRPRIPRQCFDNSYKAATASRGRLRYVEGYADGGIFPVPHAWNIDEEDRIVDTTWCGDGAERGVFTRPTIGRAYIGVVIDLDYVRSMRTNDNTSMIDRWEEGWPLLQQKYDNPYREAVAA